MGCRSIRKRLPEFVQGLLPASDARYIAEHVLTCASCREETAKIEKIWATLGALPAPDEAATLFPRVLERIVVCEQKRTSERWAWIALFKPSFAGATAAIMLIGFISGALMSSVYYPDNGQAQTDADSAYAEIISDAPPASFFDMYLQSAGQNSQENAL